MSSCCFLTKSLEPVLKDKGDLVVDVLGGEHRGVEPCWPRSTGGGREGVRKTILLCYFPG